MKKIALLALLFSLGSVQAATLKIATIVPDGTAWMNEFKKAAAEVKEKTEGRVKIKFFPGGVMGSDQSVLRKMRVGQLSGGALSVGALASFYNGTQVYGLPFLFNNHDEVRHIREFLDKDVAQGLEKKGIILLGISEGGFAYLMSDKPLRASEDLKAQKVWVPEGDVISQSVFESAGISPISLPVSDVYTGLQTGLIDTVAINPTGAIALQWHTKIKHITDEPLAFIMGTMVVSKRAFKKVSPADQQVVKAAVSAAFARMDESNYKDDQKAREALQAAGIEFIKMGDADKLKWQELATKTKDDLASKEVFPKALLNEVESRLSAFRESNPK